MANCTMEPSPSSSLSMDFIDWGHFDTHIYTSLYAFQWVLLRLRFKAFVKGCEEDAFWKTWPHELGYCNEVTENIASLKYIADKSFLSIVFKIKINQI